MPAATCAGCWSATRWPRSAMSLPWPLLLVLVCERVGGDAARRPAARARPARPGCCPTSRCPGRPGRLADRFRRDRLVRATLVARLVLLAGVGGRGRRRAGCWPPCWRPPPRSRPAPRPTRPWPPRCRGAAGAARRRATDLLVTIEVASFVVGPALGGLLLASADPAVRCRWCAVARHAGRPAAGARACRLPAPGAGRPVGADRRPSLRAARGPRRAPGDRRPSALLNAVLAAAGLALLPLATGRTGRRRATGRRPAVLGFGALAAPLLWRLRRLAGRPRPRRPAAAGRRRWPLLPLSPAARLGAAVAGGRRAPPRCTSRAR